MDTPGGAPVTAVAAPDRSFLRIVAARRSRTHRPRARRDGGGFAGARGEGAHGGHRAGHESIGSTGAARARPPPRAGEAPARRPRPVARARRLRLGADGPASRRLADPAADGPDPAGLERSPRRPRAERPPPLPARAPAHRPDRRRARDLGCPPRVRRGGSRAAGARPGAARGHRGAHGVAVGRRRPRVAGRVGMGGRHPAHRERGRRAPRVRAAHARRGRGGRGHVEGRAPPRAGLAHARRGVHPDRAVGNRDAAAPRPRPVAATAMVGRGHVRQPEQPRLGSPRRLRLVAAAPPGTPDPRAAARRGGPGHRQRDRHGRHAEPARRRRRDRAHGRRVGSSRPIAEASCGARQRRANGGPQARCSSRCRWSASPP